MKETEARDGNDVAEKALLQQRRAIFNLWNISASQDLIGDFVMGMHIRACFLSMVV